MAVVGERLPLDLVVAGLEFGRIDATDPGFIRYTVTLTLKDRKGKVSTRQVVYAVTLGSPVSVGRDPYS